MCYFERKKILLKYSAEEIDLSKLENITLNEGLEEIGDYCFNIVKLLEKINIPSTNPQRLPIPQVTIVTII